METTGTLLGSHAPDFELPGIDDRVHHLARYLEKERAVCVMFMSNQCPYVRLYLDRLKQIQQEFAPQKVTLIGINANDGVQEPEDSFEKMKSFAAEHRLNFPYLRDANQDVACSFGASTIPEAFLLDKMGIVRYHGAIDDNPDSPDAVQMPYLRQAIAQLLAGETIPNDFHPPIGSALKWRQSES